MKKIVPFFLIATALIVLAFVFTRESSPEESLQNTPQKYTAAPPQPKTASLKQPVEDGSFTLTVTSLRCGSTKVGPADPNEIRLLAQGKFCLLSLVVVNNGKEVASLPKEGMQLIASDGSQYVPDFYGTSLVNNPWRELKPGETLKAATVVFDIPRSASPSAVILHGDVNSGGINVNVAE